MTDFILRQRRLRWDIYSARFNLFIENVIYIDHLIIYHLICINGKSIKRKDKIMNKIEGKVVADGIKIGIVASRFNEFIVSKLVGGAVDGLVRHDVKDEDISVAWVPGAFEIPLAAKKMASSGKYDAVICLGTVIRGETSHYDYVCAEVSKGIAQVSLESGIPVMFGILTTDTIEQAVTRAGTKAGNKGYDCALGAIEMVNLMKQL